MSALSTSQIQNAIRRKLLEEGTDLVSEDTLLMNMNLTYDDLKYRTFTKDQLKKATIPISNGVGSLPADFGTAYGHAFISSTDKTPFSEKSLSDFDLTNEDYSFCVDLANDQLLVTPTGTSQLILRYYPTYTALSSSQDPEINEYFHELIIYGSLYRIHEDLQNESLAQYYEEVYETKLAKKAQNLSNYDEDNIGGNEMFNYKRLF